MTKIAVHTSNQDMAESVVAQADRMGLRVRHNKTNLRTGNFDGYHRYVVLNPKAESKDYSIRSRACLYYSEARHARNYLPSQRGERAALQAIKVWLEARA